MEPEQIILIFAVITAQIGDCLQLLQAIDECHRRNLRRRKAHFLLARLRDHRMLRVRQRAMLVAHLSAAWAMSSLRDRQVGRLDRRHGLVFWEHVVLNFSEDQWRQHFRMGRATFEYIAQHLRPALEKTTTNFIRPIHYKRRLGVVLWWLATPSEYRTVATLFGVAISTLCVLAREVCSALKDILLRHVISIPSGRRLEETVAGFERRGFPQCGGAIDGTHLPVIAPVDSPEDYHNRKGWHSIILQAVVDHNYCFTDIYVGWPGRTHDARVFANSDLNAVATENNGNLFSRENARVINGIQVPVFLIGDPAYPLQPWLMKGFPHHRGITAEQEHFNYRLSSARMVVENAFGRLKGRWRRLLKRNDVSTAFSSDVAVACCILHNICEVFRDEYDPAWDRQRAAEEAARDLHQPQRPVLIQQHQNDAAADIRNAVMSIL